MTNNRSCWPFRCAAIAYAIGALGGWLVIMLFALVAAASLKNFAAVVLVANLE